MKIYFTLFVTLFLSLSTYSAMSKEEHEQAIQYNRTTPLLLRNLPTELVIHILSFLDAESFRQASRVCRHFMNCAINTPRTIGIDEIRGTDNPFPFAFSLQKIVGVRFCNT